MTTKKQKILKQFEDSFSYLVYPSYFNDRKATRVLKNTVTYQQLLRFLKKHLSDD